MRGETGWLREDQIPDATALPDPADVVGVHLGDLLDVGNELLAQLALTPQLESWHFARTSVNGLRLAPLQQCQHLRIVNAAGCRVRGGLGPNLPESVEALDLSGTDINALTLDALTQRKTLRRLRLTGAAGVPAEALARFRAARPDCVIE